MAKHEKIFVKKIYDGIKHGKKSRRLTEQEKENIKAQIDGKGYQCPDCLVWHETQAEVDLCIEIHKEVDELYPDGVPANGIKGNLKEKLK